MSGGGEGSGGGRGADYRVGRLAAAGALTLAVVFLLVNDAIRADYRVDGVILTALLGAIVTLLGIEVARRRQ